jgi:hypothetical protein
MMEPTLQKMTSLLTQIQCQVSPATDTAKHVAPKNTIHVSHPLGFGLWITAEENGLYFYTSYSATDYAMAHGAQFLYLINSFNEKSDVIKYYVSLGSTVTASAYCSGEYSEKAFGRIMLGWINDIGVFNTSEGIGEFIK